MTGETRDGKGWVGKMTCEACPVQIEGLVDGLPFYFRARFRGWSFSVADTPDGDAVAVSIENAPGQLIEEEWGDGPFAAGWMPDDEAWRLVEAAIAKLRGMSNEPDPTVRAFAFRGAV